MRTVFLAIALLLSGFSFQNKTQQKSSEKEIEKAIDRGVKWLIARTDTYLKGTGKDFTDTLIKKGEELILYTFVHAGLGEKNETFKKIMEQVLSTEPEQKGTYNIALEILTLVSIDPVKYQKRIAQCAQALVNGQCKNGSWTYRDTSPQPTKDLQLDEEPDTHNKKKLKKIVIKKQKNGVAWGDNSNTQYAALGLRACYEANVEIDKDVLKLAKEYWEKAQNGDGGWDYPSRDNSKESGLVDKKEKTPPQNSSGSMTVGGLASLAAYKFLLKEETRNDKYIKKGIDWLAKNFRVDKNPQPGDPNKYGSWVFYYLYGMERAGSMLAIEKFGSHNWYDEGAARIIKSQESDGHWNGKDMAISKQGNPYPPVETCFAILFLKKATEHLFETGK